MAGLGDLAPMLNMMRQRKQDRANNEYRDSVLAQRDDQLAYQRSQDEIQNADRQTQLGLLEEAQNTPFCPSQKKFHTVVLRGVRNISEAP